MEQLSHIPLEQTDGNTQPTDAPLPKGLIQVTLVEQFYHQTPKGHTQQFRKTAVLPLTIDEPAYESQILVKAGEWSVLNLGWNENCSLIILENITEVSRGTEAANTLLVSTREDVSNALKVRPQAFLKFEPNDPNPKIYLYSAKNNLKINTIVFPI